MTNPKSPLIFFFGLSRLSSPVTHSHSLTLVTANPQAHTSPFRLPASRSRLTVSSANLKLYHASANLSWPPSVIFLFLVHFVSHCFFFICVCDFCVCVCVFYLEKENYKFEIFVFVFFILKGKIWNFCVCEIYVCICVRICVCVVILKGKILIFCVCEICDCVCVRIWVCVCDFERENLKFLCLWNLCLCLY